MSIQLKSVLIVATLIAAVCIWIYIDYKPKSISSSQTPTIKKSEVDATPKFESKSLDGHIYLSTGDEILYELDFLKDNEVVVYIYSFGQFQEQYSIIDDNIIDIKLWKKPLQYKILSDHQLALFKSPTGDKINSIMELRK